MFEVLGFLVDGVRSRVPVDVPWFLPGWGLLTLFVDGLVPVFPVPPAGRFVGLVEGLLTFEGDLDTSRVETPGLWLYKFPELDGNELFGLLPYPPVDGLLPFPLPP